MAASARPATFARTALTPAFAIRAARTYSASAATKEYTVRDALNEALAEELESNPKVFVMGEEVAQYNGAYKVTKGLLDRFGDKRVIDTPITESGFTGLAVGAALSGLHPVVRLVSFDPLRFSGQLFFVTLSPCFLACSLRQLTLTHHV